jgi:hypothetical protein
MLFAGGMVAVGVFPSIGNIEPKMLLIGLNAQHLIPASFFGQTLGGCDIVF